MKVVILNVFISIECNYNEVRGIFMAFFFFEMAIIVFLRVVFDIDF